MMLAKARAKLPRKVSSRDIYTSPIKMRGYNVGVYPVAGFVSTLDAGRLLANRLCEWSKSDHLSAAAKFERERKRLQKLWNRTIEFAALKTFGRPFNPIHDYKISAIGRDEFPENLKNILRSSAHEATFASKAAHAHKAAASFVTRSRGQIARCR